VSANAASRWLALAVLKLLLIALSPDHHANLMKPSAMHLLFPALALWLNLSASEAAGHPLDIWHTRQHSGSLSGVCHGQGLFVAVGQGGTILTSSTGEIWNAQSSGTTAWLLSVTHGNGVFVAVGTDGVLLSSSDGMTWTTRESGVITHLATVTFGSGLFVVTGSKVILTSSDGVSWARQTSSVTLSHHIVYGNGHFFVLGYSTNSLISLDGTNWIAQATDLSSEPTLYALGFGGGRFIFIDAYVDVYTSHDAVHWRRQATLTGIRQRAIAYGSGHFVTGSGGQMNYSRDGRVWTSVTGAFPLGDICYGNGTFVAVGYLQAIVQSDPIVCLEIVAPGTVEISGPEQRTYRIDSRDSAGTSDAWVPRTNITLNTNPQLWSDPEELRPPQRFYRAVMSP
jgi:hypothetical protein